MSRSRNIWLVVIILLIAFSLWVDLSKNISIPNPSNDTLLVNLNTDIRLGLDLRGGLQTLLQADVPNCASVDPNELNVTRQILESRANALGVSEVTMQVAGNCRIVAEFPGINNPEQVVAALQQTGLLEFVDMGANPVPVGTTIQTDYGQTSSTQKPTASGTAQSADSHSQRNRDSPIGHYPHAACKYHAICDHTAISHHNCAINHLSHGNDRCGIGYSISSNQFRRPI